MKAPRYSWMDALLWLLTIGLLLPLLAQVAVAVFAFLEDF